MRVLSAFLRPPTFPDPELTHQAGVLRALLLYMFGAFTVLGGLGVLFAFPARLISGVFILIATGLLLGIFYLNQRGRTRLASVSLVVCYWLVITSLVSISQGMRSLDIMFYISGAVVAGLLLGARWAAGYAVWVALTGLAMLGLSSAGVITFLDLLPLPERSGWLLLVINLTFTVIPLNATLRDMRSALQQARAELQERKRAEAALQQLHNIYRQAIVAAGAVPYYRDYRAARYTYMGDGILAMTGYPAAELTPDLWLTLEQEGYPRGSLAHLSYAEADRLTETDTALLWECDYRIRTRAGETRWVADTSIKILDERGQRLGVIGILQDITDRKRIEMELARERDLLQALTDNIPDAIYFKDRESRFIRINRAQAINLRLTDPQVAIGKTDLDFQAPHLAQTFQAEEQDLFRTGQAIMDRLEFNPLADGEPRWLSATKVPLRDSAGEVVGLVGISRDVTERELNRQSLARKAAALEAIIEVSAAISTLLEPATLLQSIANLTREKFNLYHTHIYLQRANTLELAASAGGAGAELMQQGWRIPLNHPHSLVARTARTGSGTISNDVQTEPDFLPNPLLPNTRAELALPIAAGGQLLGVFDMQSELAGNFIDEDATLYTVLARQMAVALQNAWRYELAQKEIRDRQQAEAEVQRRAAEFETLYETARALAQQTELSTLLTLIAERAQTLLAADNSFIFLFDPEQGDLEYVVSRQIPVAGQRLALGEGLAGQVAQTRQLLIVNDYQHWAGRAQVFSDRSVLACMEAPMVYTGNLIGVLGVENFAPNTAPFTDRDGRLLMLFAAQAAAAVSNTRLFEQIRRNAAELERRVAQRTAQLEAALQELESLSYTIWHDLRSPLRAMDGFARILIDENGSQLDERGLQHLIRIRSGAQRMDTLIQELLAFVRLGRQPLQIETLSTAALNRLVADLIRDLQPAPAAQRVEWIVADLLPCRADPDLLTQAFTHLLENALKFTRQLAVAQIEIGSRAAPAGPIYFVRDNGVGFEMQYAHKLFGVFQRLHKMEDFEGTGIGLALVKRIIERHGGRVWAEAQLNIGATFYFTLAPPGEDSPRNNFSE